MILSNPAITVLMSVYNGGQYLKAAIESILKQTFADFEFLIVDDASSDQSAQIIQSYQDSRIRLVRNESNLGQTRCLNKGLSLASGRYIARIDADDFAFPTWLEKNFDFLHAHPWCAVVSSQAVVIDSKNKIQKLLYVPSVYEEMVLRSLMATPLNHVGAVYKTDVIISLGGYDENFKIAADFELWSKLIRCGIRLACTKEALVAVRAHEKSLSAIERGRTDIVEISEIMMRNFNALISFAVSHDDIKLLWKLNYAPQQLSRPEFKSALTLLRKVYENIKPEFAVAQNVIKAFGGQREKVFYAKRALSQMTQSQLSELRALANDYCRLRGYFNIFSLLWLGSWLGRPITQQMPSVFNRLNSWSARRKIQILESLKDE